MDTNKRLLKFDGSVLLVIQGALFAIMGVIFPGILYSANSLSDIELAVVSGGGVAPMMDMNAIPQDQQLIESGFDASALQPLPSIDGMELAPEIFVILQSDGAVGRDRQLDLNGMTQMDVKAINLENLISSDSIASNNIFDGNSLPLESSTTGIEVNQGNSLNQLYRIQGELNNAVSGYGYEVITHIKKGTESFDHRIFSRIDLQDQSTSLIINETDWGVAVDKVNYSEHFNEGSRIFTILEPATFQLIGAAGVGGMVTGLFGEKYGAEAYYTGLLLSGPTASFDDIEPTGINGEDLLVNATVRAGNIDFGSIKLDACAGALGCVSADEDLGDLDILNLFDFLAVADPLIAPNDGISFTSDGIILEGMGSAFNDDLNLNTGFAFVGSGSLLVTDASSITTGGIFNFNAAISAGFSLDLSAIDILGIWTWPYEKSFGGDIIDMEIPFTLLNIQGDTFDDEISGELTAELGPGDVSTSSNTNNENSGTNNDLQTPVLDISSTGDSTYSELYERSSFSGGQMSGAKADLLALSEGELSVDNLSVVSLRENAQRNMRIFNGVNAVSSVSANALNLSRLPEPSLLSQAVMKQRNAITQRR